ncbi:MAG: hypothetical protein OXL96_06310 [Candidatus Poribacteria bacterium]|nr:hypothetical protein [Candidatus Poribacteria bacterium]
MLRQKLLLLLWIGISVLGLRVVEASGIVFTSARRGEFGEIRLADIYVMTFDGSNVKQLTQTPVSEGSPMWSPDGTYILFHRDVGSLTGQQFDIFIMDADGSNEQRLTYHPANDGFPTWSPNGKQIAFSSGRSGNIEVYLMDLVSGKIRQLTDNEKIGGLSSKPNFSPDGRHIVYEQVIRNAGRQIYIIDVQTGATRNFLPQRIGENDTISRYTPRFSPDGKYLLYSEVEFRIEPGAIRRTANRLIVVNNRGTGRKVLKIPKNWRFETASWAAHGTEILIAAMPNGLGGPLVPPTFDIYRYRLSTGQLTQLTNHPDRDSAPNWTRHALAVSSQGKLKTQWAEIKRENK